jgi:hypothetical protein
LANCVVAVVGIDDDDAVVDGPDGKLKSGQIDEGDKLRLMRKRARFN